MTPGPSGAVADRAMVGTGPRYDGGITAVAAMKAGSQPVQCPSDVSELRTSMDGMYPIYGLDVTERPTNTELRLAVDTSTGPQRLGKLQPHPSAFEGSTRLLTFNVPKNLSNFQFFATGRCT